MPPSGDTEGLHLTAWEWLGEGALFQADGLVMSVLLRIWLAAHCCGMEKLHLTFK